MGRRRHGAVLFAAASILAVAALVGLRTLTAPDPLLASGSEIMCDDFGVTPTSASRSADHIVLRVRVSNHARRVSFTFAPRMVELFDSPYHQVPLASGTDVREDTLEPGESIYRDLEFASGGDGPYTVRFAISGSVGDLLDGLLGLRQHEEVRPK